MAVKRKSVNRYVIPVTLFALLVFGSACGRRGAEVATSSGTVPRETADQSEPFVLWAREHAVRITAVEPGHGFADLQPLKAIIGQARVVALGESAHRVHEFLVFRNRLLEFLVHELGFTAIAVETGVSEAIQADEYINGGNIDGTIAAQSVFRHYFPSALEENRQLIDWMRDYNAKAAADRKVSG